MHKPHIYHTTSLQETLEPHEYIQPYKDTHIRETIHTYKFPKDTSTPAYIQAYRVLQSITLDMCIDRYLIQHKNYTAHIYTSPPSTMYARKEKKVDSMFTLIYRSVLKIPQYAHTYTNSYICTSSVFSIRKKHLLQTKAQHLGGTRAARTRDIQERYTVSLQHKIRLLYSIHILKHHHISYMILDDVSSTGATLVACKHALQTYLTQIQKKHPHICFSIHICSLVH